ncbi:MAG TPA: HlyD family efflux transporter periplasmic adaptor subunit [Steroidobacteraceae bacterium]|jgi:HlyD family secretion protein|nr:HlyD family efflux transporter periplasmic adaptor subunit [Steroidobacteraceae bacterium]HNS28034.1 HlyD family efflux transporter periplasmic adaptor subunit [Steroidobacteraceae bacterium]
MSIAPLVQRLLRIAIFLMVLAAVGYVLWQRFGASDADAGIASGNGRIEAVEIDVATKSAGRLLELLAKEGEFVTTGQVLARMDTESLRAQLQQAEAQARQAEATLETARSQVAQRDSERAAAQALVKQRQAELDAEQTRAQRITALAQRGDVSRQSADDARTAVETRSGALATARAQLAAAEAAIVSARSQVAAAASAIEAARATVARVQTEIDDSELKAPRDGRVQVVVARPGEVLGAGGRVLNLVDLTDVYMTFYLPTGVAGRIALGAEARVVLDAAPEYVVPARISYVADVAQFTPKTVETAAEREKLMFRVRAQIPQDLLRRYIHEVKTGLPGVAYVRTDPSLSWPEHLQVKLPQ